MNEEAHKTLRAPFPAEAISKLPRNIQDGPKKDCKVCGGYHGPTNLHLDFVGHAGVTDRLLQVDPEWTWEPVAFDEKGLPLVDRDKDGWPRGLWIRLTVAGVTRLGYGTCEKGKSDAIKELIGDALRNAAMRFGVALELWSKAELESHLAEPEKPAEAPDEAKQLTEYVGAVKALVDRMNAIEDQEKRKDCKLLFLDHFKCRPEHLPEDKFDEASEFISAYETSGGEQERTPTAVTPAPASDLPPEVGTVDDLLDMWQALPRTFQIKLAADLKALSIKEPTKFVDDADPHLPTAIAIAQKAVDAHKISEAKEAS